MRFGLQHGIGDPRWQASILEPQAVKNFARAAEQAGYSCLAFTDHPAPSGNWIDSGGEGVVDLFAALAFCAAVTTHVRLLTWVLALPYHNPFALAHRIASLDVLSGGRLDLGVGTGYLKSEFHALGADFDRRRHVFDDHIEILLKALAGKNVDAGGRGYSARGVRTLPPIVQRPHPPLWIHGNGEFGTQRAATRGQGWIGVLMGESASRTIRTVAMPDLESLQRRLDRLDQMLHGAGRKREDVEIVVSAAVPVVDVRLGWNRDLYAKKFFALEKLGVDTLIISAVGDDPIVSQESALRFAEEFVTS